MLHDAIEELEDSIFCQSGSICFIFFAVNRISSSAYKKV